MRQLFLLFAVAAALSACKSTAYTLQNNYCYVQADNRPESRWRMVWHDEFTASAIDTSKWTRIPANNADWGKHMTTDDICYELRDGMLYLNGINNPDTTKDRRPFLTGGIWSKGKFAFQYGKVEIRARLESAKGAWPAMWMLAAQDKYGKYPRNGEIDIMEHLNHDSIIYQTIHSYYTLELKQKDNPKHYGSPTFNPGEFNVFGIKWYPDRIVYILNGKETFTYPRVAGVDPSQWPFDQPFYLLIDQQLGGSWVGKVDPAQLPVRMIVDYVRVYQ